jgi:SAM-dependent methyltransferase
LKHPPEQELKTLVERWCAAIVDKDMAAAGELREEGYLAELPDGRVLTKEQELEMIGYADMVVDSMRVADLEVELNGGTAKASFGCTVDGCFGGSRTQASYAMEISFQETAGGWRARRSRVRLPDQPPPETSSRLPRRLRAVLGRTRRALTRDRSSRSHGLTYLPFRPGRDFALEATTGERPADLPVPPRELWLGYDYLRHGKGDVDAMFAAVRDSGFELRDGDRILDFGCAAGRMIRHLEPLAAKCEIWGVDISAEHVLWCKRHLSPPFHFLASTASPHLPFEDRSFRLVYAGSVFTHIDDLADAWLLELARILEPGGRLYVTIHDEHTIEQFEDGFWSSSPAAQAAKASEVYPGPGKRFDMFTVGRGPGSLVFYGRDYFARQLPPAFEPLSFIPGAYSCQTAVVARRV